MSLNSSVLFSQFGPYLHGYRMNNVLLDVDVSLLCLTLFFSVVVVSSQCLVLSQSNLTKQQNGFKITLKTLEDSLLSRLSSASGNFLGDTELVENLEITKRTAAEIEEKVTYIKTHGFHQLVF